MGKDVARQSRSDKQSIFKGLVVNYSLLVGLAVVMSHGSPELNCVKTQLKLMKPLVKLAQTK